MNKADDLARLSQLAGLVRDQALAQLGHEARRRDAIESHLAALNIGHAGAERSLEMGRAGFRHEIWAAGRRADLNLALARQQAVWLQARDAAQQAWGRAQALADLGAEQRQDDRQLQQRRQLGGP